MNQPDSDRDRAGKQVPGTGAAALVAPLSRSRRRLIRAGASAVPVIATLSSRPVLGATGQCAPASAWGSMLVTEASQVARLQSQMIPVDAWTVTEWSTDPGTSTSGPWLALLGKVSSGFANAKEMYDTLTLGQLFSDGVPAGWQSGITVKYALTSGDRLGFQSRVVTAKLNMWASGGQLNTCLSSVDLMRMAELSFAPSTGGAPWSQLQVVDYLKSNFIAPG